MCFMGALAFNTHDPDAACAQLAATQHGVIGRSQALAKGLSADAIHRRIKRGSWVIAAPRVYRLAGVPTSWLQELKTATMWAGDGSCASHRSAGALLLLDGIKPNIVEISTPGTRQSPGRELIVHRVNLFPPSDLTRISGIPTTNATRTLLDLGAVVDHNLVEIALESALRRGLTSLPRLRWVLAQVGPGFRGAGVLRKLVTARSPNEPPSESALEVRFFNLLRRSRLPLPIKQFEVRVNGRVLARVDFAYPELLLAIEIDGYQFHSGRTAWHEDRVRRNSLTSLGWRVLHVTWHDLIRRSHEIVAEIRRSLRP